MADPILMCAVCQRPVERWIAVETPQQTSRTFEAHCHGAVDVCTLGLDAMLALSRAVRTGERVEAIAFGRRALAAQPGGSADGR